MHRRKLVFLLVLSLLIAAALSACQPDQHRASDHLTPDTIESVSGNHANSITARDTPALDQSVPEYRTNVQTEFDHARSEFNIGTCWDLSQDAAIVVLFASDDESSWDQDSISYVCREVEAAAQFIRDAAAAYGYELTLPVCYYTDNANRRIHYDGVIMTGGEKLDALENIAKNWGFRDKWHMHETLQDYLEMEQLAYIVVHNKEGFCFAQSDSHMGGLTDWSQPEYCVLSMSYANGWVNQAESYVHELLHLFGAQDLYRKDINGSVYSADRAALAMRLCPGEVMLCNAWDIRESEISGFTAYCVGLIDFLPANYDCDAWWVGTQWERIYTP